MSKRVLVAEALLIFATVLRTSCNAGRTHYYGGSGYPANLAGYNNYNYGPYGKTYGYGLNGYGYGLNGYDGYDGYDNYDDYDDYGYDVGNQDYGSYGGYGGYGSYPYGYQNQVLPAKLVSSPVIKEYGPAIGKSVTTSSLYQTHPTGYGSSGYAGGYGYVPKYGSVYENGYYRK